jgi:release factor glutamine methyltransferase
LAATEAIGAAGSPTPQLDAELLLAAATGWDRARIAIEPDLRLPVGASREFGQMVRRRVRREPIAYIVGRKGFRRVELYVDRRVLIPRPETELLVDVALELEPQTALDVGTGSGAIAVALADELPEANVVAIDISFDVLRVAQGNVDRLGCSDRIAVVDRGIRSLPATDPQGRSFDLLLANLPYVSEAEWEGLAPEIREYEPREALVAGPTGLEAIEALIDELSRMDGRPAAVALEVGLGQASRVAELLTEAGYGSVGTRPDLSGVDRVVVGRLDSSGA